MQAVPELDRETILVVPTPILAGHPVGAGWWADYEVDGHGCDVARE